MNMENRSVQLTKIKAKAKDNENSILSFCYVVPKNQHCFVKSHYILRAHYWLILFSYSDLLCMGAYVFPICVVDHFYKLKNKWIISNDFCISFLHVARHVWWKFHGHSFNNSEVLGIWLYLKTWNQGDMKTRRHKIKATWN